MMAAAEYVWRDVARVRATSPLVHNITNFVVMNNTANALLAIGASPVMAHAIDEVEEMVGHASALVINIGTLSAPWIVAMRIAGQAAFARGIPIVIDPVGSVATHYRTHTVMQLLMSFTPTVIRGNASEIRSLALADATTRGVESTCSSLEALSAARQLALQYGCVVSVSGVVDIIVDGERDARVHNGHSLMKRVTGMGCTATALTGAFAAVSDSPFEAAVSAMATNGMAGEMAATSATGPGTFQSAFLDALYSMSAQQDAHRLRVDES